MILYFSFYLFEICSYGFGAYFNILPGSEWSAIMLTYGFPLAIIGMALKVNKHLVHVNQLIGWSS